MNRIPSACFGLQLALLSLGAWACGSGSDDNPDAGTPSGDAAVGNDAGTGSDGGVVADSYQPLAIGATWTYHVVDPVAGSGDQTVSVDAFEDVGGMKAGTMAFKLHKAKFGGGTSDAWYSAVGSAVVIHHDLNRNGAGMTSDEEWYAPNRIRVEDTPAHTALHASWMESIMKTNIDAVLGTVLSTERATWTVEAVDEQVTVPAGTFSCIRLRRNAGQAPKTYWFARGVGKIKETGGQTEELVSYNIPP